MKYFAKKIKYNDLTFDSKTELSRYLLLLQMQKERKITALELHKEFELLPKQTRIEYVKLKTKYKQVTRVDEKAVKYHCDFFYFDVNREKWIIEEVKSKMTAQVRDYPLRRKLVKLMVKKMNEQEGDREKYVFCEIIAK